MNYKSSVFRTLSLITQLGLSILTPIFLCVFLGNYLEEKFEIPIFIPMLILGILAGGRNALVLAKATIKSLEGKKDDEE